MCHSPARAGFIAAVSCARRCYGFKGDVEAMTKAQLQAFIEKVQLDPSLQDRLKAAKTVDEVLSMAQQHGHEFASEHLSQLSEEELEGLSGGIWSSCICYDTA